MIDALKELAEMADALGGLNWVQGPGGNVSVKTDTSELWVKASGVRLADTSSEHGHVRVPLDLARRALAGDAEAEARLFSYAPRPSLETYFHALDGRVVAHTHPVGLLLAACSACPPELGLAAEVGWVRYIRPGRGVAVAMQAILRADADEQVIVLQSHGVVAIAGSAKRAIALTQEIDARARAAFHPQEEFAGLVARYVDAVIELPSGVMSWLPQRPETAEDTVPRYLFPDAVICASVTRVDSLREAASTASRALDLLGRASVLVDPEGKRVIIARNESQLRQSIEVAAAHDWIEDALIRQGSPLYLEPGEPARLLNLPSEQYRIRLASHAGSTSC